jgi:hypothetical protein
MAQLIENDALYDKNDTDLVRNTKHVARAHTKYRTGATGMPVQADQTAREALDSAPHTVVQNADMGANLHKANNPYGVPSYTGGNIVNVAANRAGVDLFPEDTSGVEDLEHEVLVAAAVQAGNLFSRGGQIPPTNYVDTNSASPYADPMWLAEASKQTGEKHF